jgi:Ca-activated chloride channel homolog
VLTDVQLDIRGAQVHPFDVIPAEELPDLFRGSQLIILGRYEGGGPAEFSLRGKAAGGAKTWSSRMNMSAQDTEMDFIPQIWAARKIGYLLDQYRLHGSDELIKEIVQLSKEWGIPTEFTSFLVEEPTVSVMPDRRYRILRDEMESARSVQSGQWGVRQSMNSYNMKNQAQVYANAGAAPATPGLGGMGAGGNVRGYVDKEGNARDFANVQNIGARTFYQRGSQWVDGQTENQKLKTVQIKLLSNAHFKLLAAYPELARYQRLGNITLLVNNQAVEIGPQGKEDLTDVELKSLIGTPRSSAYSSMVVTATGGVGYSGGGIVGGMALLALTCASTFLRRRL